MQDEIQTLLSVFQLKKLGALGKFQKWAERCSVSIPQTEQSRWICANRPKQSPGMNQGDRTTLIYQAWNYVKLDTQVKDKHIHVRKDQIEKETYVYVIKKDLQLKSLVKTVGFISNDS